ncbi:penicillin-binding protein 2 [Rhodobacteraceae bacterium W635]|uniref:penicillin-binding protein 2 n=1 Tax=Nioella halotolerans TaxID=2303578 RepID=UPI000E3CD632|nr:penicillin-binding protein 2 [Rhodobacteraceae bacterium W635]
MKRSQKETEDSARAISRRSMVMGGLMLATSGALAARMRYLQVERASDFRLLAEENRINIQLLPPARGLIYDREGRVLANNEQNYTVVMVRENADDVDAVLDRLSRIVRIDMRDLARAREEMMARAPFVPVTIADRLSWEEFASIAVNAPALPGITPEVGLSRIYPFGQDFAHVVGYVGPVSDFYLESTGDTDPVLQIPDFQVGRYAVESHMEQDLRGETGSRRVEVNAAGRVMRELDRTPPTPGKDLQLTVDTGLQNYAQARLTDESASAVVMDVDSGEVLALVSAPSYDPNLFVRGISTAEYGNLTDDPYRPLASKTVQGTYPPGSTFKMITALAGLEAGVIDPEETITCNGSIELGTRRFHCWRRGGHGRMDLVDGLAQSCDVYYYELAQRVGIDAISAMARRFGLGDRHDLPLSGVASGLVPDRDWKRANRGAEWVVGDTLNAAIGQGFVLNSPLQLAVMTSRIATGRAVRPHLVRTVNGIDQRPAQDEDLGIDPDHLAVIREAMWNVTNVRRGTAYSSRTVEEGFEIAGKTGTSQVRSITSEERAAGVTRNEDLPWERRDHALFVGYAPAEAPRYAVSVVVEHGGGGSTVAAPIARDLLLRTMHGTVPPSSAYPVGQRRDMERMHDTMDLLPLDPLNPTGRTRA